VKRALLARRFAARHADCCGVDIIHNAVGRDEECGSLAGEHHVAHGHMRGSVVGAQHMYVDAAKAREELTAEHCAWPRAIARPMRS
jgi:hypothetical protein